jgi:hypothetical protein
MPGLRLSGFAAGQSGAKTELGLCVEQTVPEFRGVFTYRTDLFDRSTAELLAVQVREVLAAGVADPAISLASLDAALRRVAEAHERAAESRRRAELGRQLDALMNRFAVGG